ncbi:hypothetical protein B0A79_23880 [Flavobacterium piscis]|uniref:Uncharacterized protein n=1 Tax=Flavobacterium piscis TaxID=1114874 RepID=A0ABX2XJR1_9FLAO|nr:hypothetical protein [Flavobacterium piscis]OCB75555.1 hypothetical protein FLP_08800 [Flavobacterium piscis]OXE95932.1 hypothetical protein B0A79_23880 [Flavobacterium piscis]
MGTSDIINSVVAVAAIGTIILTILMIRESMLMRRFYTTPDINIYLQFAEASPSLLFIIFENSGAGVAIDAKFKLIKDYSYYNDFDVLKLGSMGIIKNGIHNFYPKQKFRYLVSSLVGDFDQKATDVIKINVTYKLDNGKKISKSHELYIEEYLGGGMHTPGDTHIRQISYRLEQIQKDFAKITSVVLSDHNAKNKEH